MFDEMNSMNQAQNSELIELTSKPSGYFSNPRLEMLGFIPKNSRTILDVGCGEGAFASEVKKNLNAEVWGLELDSLSAKKAGEKIHKVLQGDINDTISQLPNHYFNCIVFNDVLEHLVNPYEILNRIREKLTVDGVVVCSIPNVRYWRVLKGYLFGKQWKYENNGILDKTHLRFFTQKSILDMFEDLNYDIVKMQGLNPTPSVMFHFLNIFTLGFLNDCKYVQYACIVKPKLKISK